jgi:transposase
LADRAYDTNAILNLLQEQQANPVIPNKKSRLIQRPCDWWLYKERDGVEYFFNKIKQYRRIATRFEKLACTFKAFLTLASIMVWLT